MRVRAATLVPAIAIGVVLGVASAGAAASPSPSLPATAPPELLALTAKMETLTVETERFSLSESLVVSGHSKEAAFLRVLAGLFSLSISGETRRSPEEGLLTATLFGAKLQLRVLPGHTYGYGGTALARRDGGRPWVDLGSKGLAALIPGGKKTAKAPAPPSPAPFAPLARVLRSPISVTTLGGGTIDGDAVSGFRETLDPRVFESPGSLSTIAPTGSFALRVGAAVSPAPTVTTEVFIAADGLPVRTRLVQVTGPAHVVVQSDVPAINFPLTVEAPPPAQTITEAALKRLERKHRGRKLKRARA